MIGLISISETLWVETTQIQNTPEIGEWRLVKALEDFFWGKTTDIFLPRGYRSLDWSSVPAVMVTTINTRSHIYLRKIGEHPLTSIEHSLNLNTSYLSITHCLFKSSNSNIA